jgi:hypothetical protein
MKVFRSSSKLVGILVCFSNQTVNRTPKAGRF